MSDIERTKKHLESLGLNYTILNTEKGGKGIYITNGESDKIDFVGVWYIAFEFDEIGKFIKLCAEE